MYNKFSFYVTKKMKEAESKRTKRSDFLATSILFVLLLGGFVLMRGDGLMSVGSTAASASDNEKTGQVSFVGDVMLGRFMQSAYEKEGIDGIFEHAKRDWAASEKVVANLENSIVRDTEDTSSYNIDERRINLAIDGETMQDLAANSGIDVFNLGNNHMADYGVAGMQETLAIMQEQGIEQTGLHANYTQIDEMYSVMDVNDQKIALVSFSDIVPVDRGLGVGENKVGVILPSTEQGLLLRRVIRQAKQETDLVFVYAHWGQEYTYEPSGRQKELAQDLVDYGADLVVGAHPHVVQPVEFIDGVPVVYSLGNFIFDQGQGSTVSSVMMHVQTANGKVNGLEFEPYKIVNGIPNPEHSKLARQVTYRKLTKQLEDVEIDHSEYRNIKMKVQEE